MGSLAILFVSVRIDLVVSKSKQMLFNYSFFVERDEIKFFFSTATEVIIFEPEFVGVSRRVTYSVIGNVVYASPSRGWSISNDIVKQIV